MLAGLLFKTSRSEVFWKKVFLEILKNLQENTCARVSFFLINFTKKETLAQMFTVFTVNVYFWLPIINWLKWLKCDSNHQTLSY